MEVYFLLLLVIHTIIFCYFMVDGRFFDWIAWLGLLVQLMMIFLFVPLVMGVAGLFQNDAELA